MNAKNYLKVFAGLVAVAMLSVSCQRQLVETVSTLTRSTDKLSIDYSAGSTATFTVRSNGHWSVSSDSGWLDFEPSEGDGDGVNYTTVTVTATGNTGNARMAIIYLDAPGQEPLEIHATQASGFFELGTPAISGSFRLNNPAKATIDIPYKKAQGGETVGISAVLSGDAAAGITFVNYEYTIPGPGDGTVSAPFSGIPSMMGDFNVSAELTLKGAVQGTTALATCVMDANTILYLPASRFPWGGHYVEGTAGVRSYVGENIGCKPDDELVEVAAGSPGTTDLFRSGMEEFMLARGLGGYAGSKVYEHGGALKIGTSAAGGYFTTPKLSDLEAPTDLQVKFRYARWAEAATNTYCLEVVALNAGEAVAGKLPMSNKAWMDCSVTILGATNETQISWTTNGNQCRSLIGEIEVCVASDLKEPLAVPSGLTVTPFEKSMEVSWNSVPNATCYDVTLAPKTAPKFQQVQRVTATSYTFEELTPDTEYVATVRAVYEKNEAMNSEYSEAVEGKTLFLLPSLDKPVIKVFKSERAMVIVSWESDLSTLPTRKYVTELRDKDGAPLRAATTMDMTTQVKIDHNRFVFAGLAPSTQYKIAVKRLSTDATQYNDSEWAVLDYTSEPDVDNSKYVFYEDFNDLWIGGNNNNLAWGPHTATTGNYAIGGYTTKEDAAKGTSAGCVPEATTANAWTTTFTTPYAYLDDYWHKWNYGVKFDEDAVNSEKAIQIMLYPGAGCVKYGSGSANGCIVLPALKSLTEPTDVEVTFDMVPYAIATATDKELVTITECQNCCGALWAGSEGTIEGAGAGGFIVFDVKSPKDLGSWTNQTFKFTVKGATASTRIAIASGNAGAVKGGKARMWLDKVTVVKK